jgi:outer membrane protein OmpA-like peptidoglycan-associated protein
MSIGRPLSTALRIILILTAFVTSGVVRAQNHTDPYYVVVGGFAVYENAARFTQHMLAENYPARYAFNSSRKLYYVYVKVTGDKSRARQIAYQLRLESEFTGTWIYQGTLQGNAAAEGNAIAEYDAETGAGVLPATAGSDSGGGPDAPAIAANQSGSSATTTSKTITSGTDSAATSEATANSVETASVKPAGKEFIFRLTTGSDNAEVPGLVYLIRESDKQSQRITANEKVIIPSPASGKLVIVCNVVGYKLAKRIISYEGAGAGEAVVPIKLVPVAQGDYIELDNVKFFDHTTIFTPESEHELLQLVNMMKNPRCRVRLHGHTHSNESGDITTQGTATNFFALDPSANATSHGSGKELSRLRAEAVKTYLVGQGIDAGRISTKGYGAQLAVYEEAVANNRIEVEILKN